MLNRFLVFGLSLAFAPLATADFVEITASTSYAAFQKVQLNF